MKVFFLPAAKKLRESMKQDRKYALKAVFMFDKKSYINV